ncbi:hypothetical protein [Aurantimonas sp. 22II-16-19i]|uniref:hypothetical protein n=1 Tax=Aurantimonas sp. 22II-16-19i TaxID=1317114 RepID=UPI0009F7A77F|nr:hypothetical protein [Aurantimonas sp. 22II-16-19i]ORE90966.1 hypothetical protein ATO4_19929 [Aurantimonas sp. 22II-16-19i]
MIQFRTLTDAELARMAAAHRAALGEDRAIPEATPAAEAMAARMIDHAALTGACTDADLIEAGYTPDDLRRHAATARRIAYGLTERVLS